MSSFRAPGAGSAHVCPSFPTGLRACSPEFHDSWPPAPQMPQPFSSNTLLTAQTKRVPSSQWAERTPGRQPCSELHQNILFRVIKNPGQGTLCLSPRTGNQASHPGCRAVGTRITSTRCPQSGAGPTGGLCRTQRLQQPGPLTELQLSTTAFVQTE